MKPINRIFNDYKDRALDKLRGWKTKFRYSKKAIKFQKNSQFFYVAKWCQIRLGDSLKFCGLLRIFELYQRFSWVEQTTLESLQCHKSSFAWCSFRNNFTSIVSSLSGGAAFMAFSSLTFFSRFFASLIIICSCRIFEYMLGQSQWV